MRLNHRVLFGLMISLSTGILSANGVDEKTGAARERKFQLDYGVVISGLKPGENVQVWLPVPQTNEDQTVLELPGKFPVKPQVNTETLYGNKIAFFEVAASEMGSVSSLMSFQVRRREVRGLPGERVRQPMSLSDAERKLHLAPNKKIPLTGKPLELLEGVSLPKNQLALGRVFY